MSRRFGPSSYIILALIALGVITRMSNGLTLLIPVLIIGGVIGYNYYLGKQKQSSYASRYSSTSRYSSASRHAEAKKKSKTVPFRVIPGSKRDPGDEPKPKFH